MRKLLFFFSFFLLITIICYAEVVLILPLKDEKIEAGHVLFKWTFDLSVGKELPYRYSIYIGGSPTELDLYNNNIVDNFCYIYNFPNVDDTTVYWQVNAEYLDGRIIQSEIGTFQLLWKKVEVKEQKLPTPFYRSQSENDSMKIEGKVIDANTKKPIEKVTLILNDKFLNIPQYIKTNEEGLFSFNIPYPSIYRLSASKSGYVNIEQDDLNILIGEKKYFEPFEMIHHTFDGRGSIEGRAFDASDLYGRVNDANIFIRKGLNNINGELYKKTSIISHGNYIIQDLPAGYYTLEFQAPGYIPNYFNVSVVGGKTIFDNNITLSRILSNPTDIRVVLNWSDSLLDLDACLSGSLNSGEVFQSFHQKAKTSEIKNLSEQISFDLISNSALMGPETITIKHPTPGDRYQYTVKDQTNKDSNNCSAISNSKAVVVVYQGEQEITRLAVPPNGKGKYWYAFEILIEIDGKAYVKPINELTDLKVEFYD